MFDFKRQKTNDFYFYPPLNPLPRGDLSNSPLERGRGVFIHNNKDWVFYCNCFICLQIKDKESVTAIFK